MSNNRRNNMKRMVGLGNGDWTRVESKKEARIRDKRRDR